MYRTDKGIRLSRMELPNDRVESLSTLGTSQPAAKARFRVAEVAMQLTRRSSVGVKTLTGFLDGPGALRALRETLDEETERFDRYRKLSAFGDFLERRLKRSAYEGPAPHTYLVVEELGDGKQRFIDVDGYARNIDLVREQRAIDTPRLVVEPPGISLAS